MEFTLIILVVTLLALVYSLGFWEDGSGTAGVSRLGGKMFACFSVNLYSLACIYVCIYQGCVHSLDAYIRGRGSLRGLI